MEDLLKCPLRVYQFAEIEGQGSHFTAIYIEIKYLTVLTRKLFTIIYYLPDILLLAVTFFILFFRMRGWATNVGNRMHLVTEVNGSFIFSFSLRFYPYLTNNLNILKFTSVRSFYEFSSFLLKQRKHFIASLSLWLMTFKDNRLLSDTTFLWTTAHYFAQFLFLAVNSLVFRQTIIPVKITVTSENITEGVITELCRDLCGNWNRFPWNMYTLHNHTHARHCTHTHRITHSYSQWWWW